MRFVEIDFDPRELPVDTRHRPRGVLIEFFEAFMKSGCKFARVEYTPSEYRDSHSAHVTIRQRIREDRLPVQITERAGVLYLIRTDL